MDRSNLLLQIHTQCFPPSYENLQLSIVEVAAFHRWVKRGLYFLVSV